MDCEKEFRYPTPEEERPRLPAPHSMGSADWPHRTWLISPQGDLYKIPFMEHATWIMKYMECLPQELFDDHGEWLGYEMGWVRVSGVHGQALVYIDVLPGVKVHLPAVTRFIMQFAALDFFVDGFRQDYRDAIARVREITQRGRKS